jgi:hypothetical protein
MPRAADHRDALKPFLQRGANRPAHVRLAALLDDVRLRNGRPQRRHRFLQGGEETDRIEPLLDLLLPPLLRVFVSRGARKRLQRVRAAPFAGLTRGELDRLRQIHEPRRNGVLRSPAQSLPFRREHGERVEDAASGRVRRIDEQGDGRGEVLVPGKPNQLVAVGRALDQEGIRDERIEGSAQRAGASRPVVADPEEVHSFRHSSTSMQAR